MFGRAYISSLCSVDAQAAFLREEARFDHIAKLRSVSTRRAPGLPQKLPTDRTTNLLADPKLSELHRRLCDLRAQGAPKKEIEAANRRFRIHRQWTKKNSSRKMEGRLARQSILSNDRVGRNRVSSSIDQRRSSSSPFPHHARTRKIGRIDCL